MDRISIKDLRVATRIGVTPQERAAPQNVLISVDIWKDLTRPGTTDDLADTIDYHAVCVEIAAMVRAAETNLLEHLAEKIAAQIGGLSGGNRVSVEVTKESVPIPEDVGAVSVRIERPAR